MISGSFGDNGELFFEIRLVDKSGLEFSIEAILDTGFTNGWLAIDTQDLDTLGWSSALGISSNTKVRILS
jgi:predicted aspartyl protease